MGWFDDNGFSPNGDHLVRPGNTQPPIVTNTPGSPVPGMPGFVYNSAGGYEPIDGTPNGPGETTNANGVSSAKQPPATPPPTTPTTPNAPSQNVGHDGTYNGMTREQYRDAWMSSGVNSVQGMKDWLAKNGGKWVSDNGTVETPFGETLDMGGNARGSAAGNGVLRPAWGGGGGDTGGAGAGSAGGNMNLGALGQSGGFGMGQTASAPGNFAPGNYEAGQFSYGQSVPQTERVNYTPFKMPTRDEAMAADPGFQFGLDQGLGQLGAQASARGSIRDPNYQQAMTKFAIDYGNTHYADAANRLFQTHQANQTGAAGAVGANNATALGAQGQGFGQALGGYQANLGALGQNYGQGANTWNLNQNAALGWGNLALGNKSADNSYALGQGNLGLNRDQFGLAQQGQYWNQAFNNNAQTWDQYYKLAQLGYPQS